MTAAERRYLRRQIDRVKRERLARAGASNWCAYCGVEIEQRESGSPKRFCSKAHRTAAWVRDTQAGREWRRRQHQAREQQPLEQAA